MEPGGSMPHSQGLSNNAYPEPNQPNYPNNNNNNNIIIIITIINIIIVGQPH